MPVPVIPQFSNLPVRGTPREVFTPAVNQTFSEFPNFITQTNAVAANVNANATEAESEAGIAAAQAVIARDQAVIATDQAVISNDKSVISATKADESKASAVSSESSRIAADKRYLGAKSSQPTLDNQGAALEAGAVYYDTAIAKVRTWNGTSWVEGISSVAGVSSVNGLSGAVIIPPTPEIITPSNTSPSDSATDIGEKPTLTGSGYYSLYGLSQSAIQIQVNASNTFTSPLYSSGDQAAGVSFKLPSGELSVSTQYYWRVRYKDSNGIYSDWSTAFSFITASAFPDYIATPAATPAAFGDAFEGGFYTGMLWNELVQSSTSTAIATGSKEFTVPSMTGAPLVYEGQALEVRSRANPAKKMIGTVTFAQGTTLTIDVTSVGGSGTFTDWSIMAKYRLIVAPKSSGENASIAYKNVNTAAPSATGTLTEGMKATLAMVSAGTSTVYPAAHWCNDLSISSKTDWYLPARDELELAWRNLKPATDNNYTSARGDSAIDYKTRGSLDDTDTGMGHNLNSSPQGAEYTSGSPAQTAALAFRTGGAEAFEYGSAYYWSSSEYSASNAWSQYWHSSLPGLQGGTGKTGAGRVRAVRRSII